MGLFGFCITVDILNNVCLIKKEKSGMGSKLTYASLPSEIKKIANESLGLGVLRSMFSYANTYHLIIKISDGIFIGFALYHFHTTRMSDGTVYTTGVVDGVCVSTAYRKEGFGTLLTFSVLRKMSAYGVDRVELMLKTPQIDDRDGEPGFPLIGNEHLLSSMGFRKVEQFDKYFEQSSRKFAYDCLFCGNRPDTCMAVLYAIDNKE